MNLKKKLEKMIKDGEKEIYINLINTGMTGPALTKRLIEAGYEPDNMGPQRTYIKK
jgi:hypothetical protein